MNTPIYVVLAAGRATRMGFAKVFTPLGNASPLERIVTMLSSRPIVIVTGSAHAELARRIAPMSRAVVVNDEPDRGMTYSLRLGLPFVPGDRAFGVILGDMPFVSAATLTRLEVALVDDIDLVAPVDTEGKPGHPVLFAPHMRARIDALPEGDTLRAVRNDRSLRSVHIETEDPGAFTDLDNPTQWKNASQN